MDPFAALRLTQELTLQVLLLFWAGIAFVLATLITLTRNPLIKAGMSEDEVRDALGRPIRMARSPNSRRAKWIYDSRTPHRQTVVSFQSGVVNEVRKRTRGL